MSARPRGHPGRQECLRHVITPKRAIPLPVALVHRARCQKVFQESNSAEYSSDWQIPFKAPGGAFGGRRVLRLAALCDR